MAMDLVMELVREAARDANVDAFAPHDDMATFARERDYNDWLARSYGDQRAGRARWSGSPRPTPMLVTTDAFSSPTPARTRCLVHFDFPRDASQYRARMAGAFSCDDDDACGGELHVISLVVGAGEAARLRSTADALRCRVDEFDIETLAEIRTARAP
jgi:hypothetical protein